MISQRQHAVSLIAVFLALAVGVVLGSGLLSGNVLSSLQDDKSDLQGRIDALQNDKNALGEQLNAAGNFDSVVAGRIVAGSLADRSVIVITTPDADPADLDSVTSLVGAAGGSVSGTVALTDSFLSAANGDDLRTRVTNVVPAGIQLNTGAVDQGSLAGDLLGSVLLLDAQSALPRSTPEEMGLALDTLRSGGFITYNDNAVQPGQLAIVLTGGSENVEDGNRGAIVARFAGAFDARGAGVVLAGRAGSARGTGPIAVVRSDAALSSAVSTVDNLDQESGRITTMLALGEQLAGGAGRYGNGPNATSITVGAASN